MSRHLSALLIALSACAPTLEGTDQVRDINVDSTRSKDAQWDFAKNSVVDALAPTLLDAAPGCAVGVMVDGEIDYLHGYGWAREELSSGDNRVYTELGKDGLGNIDAGISKAEGEWHVGTVGPVGSVSKIYTALAAVQLTRTGGTGWSLDMEVEDLLPSTGDIGPVTLRALLDHSAGVGGKGGGFAPDFGGKAFDNVYSETYPTAYPRYMYDEFEATTPVDGKTAYSNVGYAVIGAMIDQHASDEDPTYDGYERWVWKHVGQPYPSLFHASNARSLSLLHSWRKDDIPDYAHGYNRVSKSNGGVPAVWSSYQAWEQAADLQACEDEDGNTMHTEEECMAFWEGWEGPPGGWALTIGDLTRLTVAMDDNVIISGTALQNMAIPTSDPLGTGSNEYGQGLFTRTAGSGKPARWGHEGGIGGHSAAVYYYPEAEVEVLGAVPPTKELHASMGVALICNRQIGQTTYSNWADSLHANYVANDWLDKDYDPSVLHLAPNPSASVPAESLDGKLFALDLSLAHTSAPEDLDLPLELDGDVPLLATSANRSGGLDLRLGAGTVRSGTATQDSKVKVISLGTTSYRENPKLDGSSSSTFSLPTSDGSLVLESPSVTAWAASADTLVSLDLSGRLDLRSVSALGDADDRADLCRNFGDAGACEACADGKEECLDVTVSNVVGRSVSGSLR